MQGSLSTHPGPEETPHHAGKYDYNTPFLHRPAALQAFGTYAFTHNPQFWRGMGWSLLAGAVIGLCSLAYLTLILYTQTLWQGKELFKQSNLLCFKCGKLWWIALSAAIGLLAGLLRVWLLPIRPKGFIVQARTQKVDKRETPAVLLLSLLALAAGASVGPEFALSSLGGALSTWWGGVSRSTRWMPRLSAREQRMNTVTGICAALGAVLPAPILALMIVYELGSWDAFGHHLESTAHTAVASIASYLVFQCVNPPGGGIFERMAITRSHEHEWTFQPLQHTLYAILLGAVAAVLGALIITLISLFDTIIAKIEQRLGRLTAVATTSFVGLVVGITGYALPLTIGDGWQQLPLFMKLQSDNPAEAPEFLSTEMVAACLCAKLLLTPLCFTGGFVGGTIFPTFYVGVTAGVLANRIAPHALPLWMSAPCMMAAVPASFVPAPICMILLSALSFTLGVHETTAVLISVIVSYCMQHLLFLDFVIKGSGGSSTPPPPPDSDEESAGDGENEPLTTVVTDEIEDEDNYERC